MSKLRCDCGHTIVDQTDYIRYKGRLARDQDDTVWERAWGDLADLVAAARDGRVNQWVAAHLPGSDEQNFGMLVMNYLTRIERDYMPSVYECTACGRLLVEQAPHANRYLAYSPDSRRYEGLLASRARST